MYFADDPYPGMELDREKKLKHGIIAEIQGYIESCRSKMKEEF